MAAAGRASCMHANLKRVEDRRGAHKPSSRRHGSTPEQKCSDTLVLIGVPTSMPDIRRVNSSTRLTRHFRERQRSGVRMDWFELLTGEIDAFVRGGLVTAAERDDRAALFKALEHVFHDWLGRQLQSS